LTTKERLYSALNGDTPDITPLSFYSWMEDDIMTDDWKRLYDMGLGICHHCEVIKFIEHGVEDSEEVKNEGSDTYRIYRKKTPVGILQRVTRNGWHHEDWIKTPEDYKIRQWIVENTELKTDYNEYFKAEEFVGNIGIPIIRGSRTPAMSINVDWAGTEKFCLDIAMEIDEVYDLYHAQKKLFIEETKLIASGPGRFIKWFENLTISMLGPKRYKELLVSIYDETLPILNSAEKRLMVHYDGALNVIKDQIAAAPFHIIESLTEPPEGDMMYDECRAAWQDKAFWANINVDLYFQPKEKLQQAVIAKRERAGKKAFAFELSEDLPSNWRESIPVVLDTLNNLK
jgi:hypothetical protein